LPRESPARPESLDLLEVVVELLEAEEPVVVEGRHLLGQEQAVPAV